MVLSLSTRIKPDILVITRVLIKDQNHFQQTKCQRWAVLCFWIESAVIEAFGSISVGFVLHAAGFKNLYSFFFFII